MSESLISRSPDLERLRSEGFEVEVSHGLLLVHHVPYVTDQRQIELGTLISTLELAGDRTATPVSDHTAHFSGGVPCDSAGAPLSRILHSTPGNEMAPGIFARQTFSAKPPAGYSDYYEKMVTYVARLEAPARQIDADATARTFRVLEADDPGSAFEYLENASSRAGIRLATEKLRGGRLGIVGLGGTGAYILDLIAKTEQEIHLFDGDKLRQHNAFRSPGAPSREELESEPMKVEYFRDRYRPMHRAITAHPVYLDEKNLDLLAPLDFVFICVDDGPARRLIVEALEAQEKMFIDVGMGLGEDNAMISGLVRVTTSTPEMRDHVRSKNRIPLGVVAGDNDYGENIQIADLNALNAVLAVMRWKKLRGFYVDTEHEHFSAYTIGGNRIINDDLLEP
jgi:hypothetical protein